MEEKELVDKIVEAEIKRKRKGKKNAIKKNYLYIDGAS